MLAAKWLLDKMQEMAVEFEIDEQYLGVSHDSKLESNFFYSDHEFYFTASDRVCIEIMQ